MPRWRCELAKQHLNCALTIHPHCSCAERCHLRGTLPKRPSRICIVRRSRIRCRTISGHCRKRCVPPVARMKRRWWKMSCAGGETRPIRARFHLFLATRGEDTDLAVRLAQEEFQQREDVFTHDALAWALAAAGRVDEAGAHLEHALAEGTQDARLFFHAAVIESRAGRFEEAEHWFTSAAAMDDLLLPSEQALLFQLPDQFAAVRADSDDSSPASEPETLSASSR